MSNRARSALKVTAALVAVAGVIAGIASPAFCDDVDEVKQVVAKMIEAAKAKQADTFADFYVADDAKVIKKFLADMEAVEEKAQKLSTLVKTKLDKEMKDMSGPGKGGGPLDEVAKTSLDDLTFKTQNGTVTFTDKKGETETFVKQNGTWKGKLDAGKKEILGVMVEMLDASDKMLDAVTAGVNDGSITKDNFDQKAEQIGKTHTSAVMAKLMAIMMKAMTEGMAKAPGAPASQPATGPATGVAKVPTTAPATGVATAPVTDLDKAVKEAVAKALGDTRPATEPAGERPPAPGARPDVAKKLADEKLAKTWGDFLHYVRIAQVPAAKSFAQALLDSKPDPKRIYELSIQSDDTHKVLVRGSRLGELKPVIGEIRKMIETGYEQMRKDPAEIRKSIGMLVKSVRAYEIGARRLVRSGEYAMPQIVQTLMDPKIEPLLRERLIMVLPRMGKAAVLPLSVALQCDQPHLQQIFAEALGQIQYPHAGPRLRQFLERKDLLKRVRNAAESALVSCSGQAALKKSAAEMFHDLAEKFYYQRESLRPDERSPKANVWYWRDDVGVVYKVVPRQIFCDIYAMRMSRLALKHDPKFYPAVSLWLAAHINKETHLGLAPGAEAGQGAKDPTRGEDQPPARFYALAASARFQQAVLARGLRDYNTQLVLAVMKALVRTNGAKNMVKVHGGAQPLVEALSYPDRNVRFMAAEALATALPDEEFNGHGFVVSVLIEALRQTARKKAMIVVKDPTALNTLKDAVRAAGYEVMENSDPVRALTQVSEAGGVDVFVVDRSPGPEQLVVLLRQRGQFVTTPVVAAVTGTESRRELAERDKRLVLIGPDAKSDAVAKALAEAAKLAAGKPMTPQEADKWAVRAAKAIRLLAVTRNTLLDYNRAQGALIEALKTKAEIQVAAAEALSVMPSADAQRAIADLANDAKTAEGVRIAAYNSLIASVRKYGNQLSDAQSQSVVAVVLGKGSHALREAAAQTLSPLDLASEKMKQLILSTEGMD